MMDLVTCDFETFYGDDYTLSKLTTEEYVRDPRFEAILCSFRVNSEPAFWVPKPDLKAALRDLRLERRAVLMHHAHFDGLILSYHYGIFPQLLLDTLSMARALHGANGRLSLGALAERYGLGVKGDEVIHAKGLHFADFTPQQLARYGAYSCNDSDLTWQLAERMVRRFSRTELEIHDQIIRMFTEPVLELDTAMLHTYAERLRVEKLTLMLQAGVQRADLMSADRFAQALRDLGVEPPVKVSPAWLKKAPGDRPALPVMVYAFAKTDPGMQALQEHPDEHVQMLVEARLKNKTTIAEKGALRLIGMASRGPATVYLKVSGASGTHRLSGGDKFNWQSMKRRSDLRNAVQAPAGSVVVVGDSSQVEARVLDWLAGQDDMVEVYRRHDAGTGPDPYCVLGEKIYGRAITKEDDPDERQLSKKAKLGLGFGMGDERFALTVRGEAKTADGRPLVLTPSFSLHVVEVYRESHYQVKKLWRRGEAALAEIARGIVGVAVDFRGLVRTCTDGLVLPGGLKILYPDLKYDQEAHEWTFWNGKARERIYGAKVIENIVQCLARIIVFGQCLATAREARGLARWAHSVHDEGIFVTALFHAPWLLGILTGHMRIPPDWAPDLPLNSEGGFHQRYGQAKS